MSFPRYLEATSLSKTGNRNRSWTSKYGNRNKMWTSKIGTGTKLGLQILLPEQNMDFKYGYRNKKRILFWYQYLKSKFCSGTHFVPVTIF